MLDKRWYHALRLHLCTVSLEPCAHLKVGIAGLSPLYSAKLHKYNCRVTMHAVHTKEH